MLGQLVEVLLLLGEALPELQELLLLALADGVILVGLLAALEGVSVRSCQRPSRCSSLGTEVSAHPWPPVLEGAPVSPSAMARAVVLKVARSGRKAAVLVKVVRSIVSDWGGLRRRREEKRNRRGDDVWG